MTTVTTVCFGVIKTSSPKVATATATAISGASTKGIVDALKEVQLPIVSIPKTRELREQAPEESLGMTGNPQSRR